LWVQFEEIIWDPERQFIILANDQEDEDATFFFNYETVLPGSRTLWTFVREDLLQELGGVIDDDAVKTIISKLPGWNAGINYKWEKTDWAGDPSFGGGWEVWKFDPTKNYFDYDQGIQPRGNLHVAGSPHCREFWGFTWGAVLNGIWNAEWIVNRLAGSDEIPYTPCEDLDIVTNGDMRRFYEKFGDLFTP